MSTDRTVAFWSYTHADNAKDQERLTRLAEQIADEYSLITGDDEFNIFVDRTGIGWGDAWRERIGDALAGTTFFIPVVTPRYFKSEECRRELLAFHAAARSLGDYSFIMPILYVDVPGLREESDDEAIAMVASMQYESWTGLRLLDESTSEYRTAVNVLATRLAELIDKAAEAPEALPPRTAPALSHLTTGPEMRDPTPPVDEVLDEDDDSPGIVDLLAEFSPGVEAWTETTNKFPAVLEEVAEIANRGAGDITDGDRLNNPFAHRIVIMRRMAEELSGPAREIESLGTAYAAQAMDLDPSMRTLLELIGSPDVDEEDREQGIAFLASLSSMVDASRTNAETLKGLSASINTASKLSRDMRRPLKQINSGLRGVRDAQGVIEEWARLAFPPDDPDDQ